jgi:hypothetical protein
VYAVDRLGRDDIDEQTTIRSLIAKRVIVDICGLGKIAQGVGGADHCCAGSGGRHREPAHPRRTTAGREVACTSLATTGTAHWGKISLGKPVAADAHAVKTWRKKNSASIRVYGDTPLSFWTHCWHYAAPTAQTRPSNTASVQCAEPSLAKPLAVATRVDRLGLAEQRHSSHFA